MITQEVLFVLFLLLLVVVYCVLFFFLNNYWRETYRRDITYTWKIQLGCRISNPSWKCKILKEMQLPVKPVQPSAEFELRTALQQKYQEKLPMSFMQIKSIDSSTSKMQATAGECLNCKAAHVPRAQTKRHKADDAWFSLQELPCSICASRTDSCTS